jgi:AcrR family transcriptional regulator
VAPSKDELVLIVLDRFLHRVGRTALDAIDPTRSFADQIAAYFLGGIELQRLTHVFGEDLADDAAARRLFDRHFGFVMAVTEQLVTDGVSAGEFRPVDPAIVAGVLAGAGMFFNQPDVRSDAGLDLEVATEGALELVVRSIRK